MQPIDEERHAGIGGNRALPFWTASLILVVVAGAALFTSQLSSQPSPANVETRTWPAMGTVVSLSLCEADRDREEALFKLVALRVDHIEEILSPHMPASELSRLNRLPSGEKMRVSHELWHAVNAGKIWNGKTRGAFDLPPAR